MRAISCFAAFIAGSMLLSTPVVTAEARTVHSATQSPYYSTDFESGLPSEFSAPGSNLDHGPFSL